MKVEVVQTWDEDFFTEFINFKNLLYKDFSPRQFKETKLDFYKFLEEKSPFNIHNEWRAVLIKNERGQVCARAIVNKRKEIENTFMPLGYFEAIDQKSSHHLFQELKKIGKNWNISSLRGPINLDVFNSSRFKTFQSHTFLTETIHNPEYLNYFDSFGFKTHQTWYSYKSKPLGRFSAIAEVFKKSKKKNQKTTGLKLKTRKINLDKWDDELNIFYELIMDSFSEMKDVTTISKEEFSLYLKDLKLLLIPRQCLIIELENKPIAFVCCLLNFQNELVALSYKDNLFNRLRFFLKKTFGYGEVLLLYMGKKKEIEKAVPGIGRKLLLELAKKNFGFLFNTLFFGYVQEGSKSYKILASNLEMLAQYCTFELNLD